MLPHGMQSFFIDLSTLLLSSEKCRKAENLVNNWSLRSLFPYFWVYLVYIFLIHGSFLEHIAPETMNISSLRR